MLYLVAPRGSLALHFPYPHPRQGQGSEREWGPAQPQASFRGTGDLLSTEGKSSAKWTNC